MILENGLSAPCLIEEWMNFDQTYIQVYCDLEFIIDTIYFNNMSVQSGGGTYRKHCSSMIYLSKQAERNTEKIVAESRRP